MERQPARGELHVHVDVQLSKGPQPQEQLEQGHERIISASPEPRGSQQRSPNAIAWSTIERDVAWILGDLPR